MFLNIPIGFSCQDIQFFAAGAAFANIEIGGLDQPLSHIPVIGLDRDGPQAWRMKSPLFAVLGATPTALVGSERTGG
ncbi:MAG: hypothetical protein DRH20_13865 [Deltaproteobacteria bacterium]|nr:MAG: hypothetical protein DRH20_13865 [Deltaproteobacteria bacterium]